MQLSGWIVFPSYALMVVEERIREHIAEGIRIPISLAIDELALRILVANAVNQASGIDSSFVSDPKNTTLR
jgi:hypothetical protein